MSQFLDITILAQYELLSFIFFEPFRGEHLVMVLPYEISLLRMSEYA